MMEREYLRRRNEGQEAQAEEEEEQEDKTESGGKIMNEEKLVYTLEDIMGMFNKTRGTVRKWAVDNSLEGFQSYKQGKSWFFRKKDGSPPAAKESSASTSEMAELKAKVKDLEGQLAEEKEKHLKEIKTITDKDDEVRRKLESDRKETEGWIKAQREETENERSNRLADVVEREVAATEREGDLANTAERNTADAQANETLKQELLEKTKTVEAMQAELEELLPNARKDVEENLNRILAHLKGGTVGLVEQAQWLLTESLVERAYAIYVCPDCKMDGSDGVRRQAAFRIPRLDEISPEFGVCRDCPETANRRLPTYLCEICPAEARMREVASQLDEALLAMGIRPEYNGDGQYIPAIWAGDEKRKMSDAETIKRLREKLEAELEAEGTKVPWAEEPKDETPEGEPESGVVEEE